MGLFTTTDDKHLEAARKLVVSGDSVCPHCKAQLTMSGETLMSFNASLGIEGHKCPSCGQIISRRRLSSDGF